MRRTTRDEVGKFSAVALAVNQLAHRMSQTSRLLVFQGFDEVEPAPAGREEALIGRYQWSNVDFG